MRVTQVSLVTLLATLGVLPVASAQQAAQFTIVVQNGQFSPPQIRSPADAPFTLKVTNLGTAPVEFASSGMRVDRTISPNTSVTMQVGALRRGRYSFFDLAHAGTNGVLLME